MKSLKTLFIALIIGGLLLGAVSPALAASPDKGDKAPWWQGKVEVVQGKASISNVSLPSGATGAISVDNETIYVTANTTYKVPGLETAGINDIDGMYIVAQCDKTDSGLWAQHIMGIPGWNNGKPEYGYQHYTGNVTAYNYDPNAGGSITIQDKSGNTIPFQINDGNFKIMPPGATVAAGDWVTVVGHREATNGPLIAVGVSVFQASSQAASGHISGQISYIDESIITIANTNITYNGTTLFVLRGVTAVEVNQQATIFYTQQGDNKTANMVLVGVEDTSKIWQFPWSNIK
jgi:hypothetical protein